MEYGIPETKRYPTPEAIVEVDVPDTELKIALILEPRARDQILAWFCADVIKVERPGVGDITRGQLQDVPKADSFYFTMLNHNKRSIVLDAKNPKGKEAPEWLTTQRTSAEGLSELHLVASISQDEVLASWANTPRSTLVRPSHHRPRQMRANRREHQWALLSHAHRKPRSRSCTNGRVQRAELATDLRAVLATDLPLAAPSFSIREELSKKAFADLECSESWHANANSQFNRLSKGRV